jgi:hypothetical protein
LTGVSNASLSATLAYDADGHRTNLIAGSATTGYGYDSRLTTLSYTTTGNNSLGWITYNSDNDSRVTSEGGSLAAVNLPHSETNTPNTYYSTNQIKKWNGTSTTVDNAANLTTDPVTAATYGWDSRNELSSINTSTYTDAYDSILRRYNSPTAEQPPICTTIRCRPVQQYRQLH